MSTNNSHEDPLSPNYTPPILSGIPNLSSIPIRSPLPGQPQPHFRPQPLPPPPSNSVWSISSQPPPLTPRSPQAYSSPSRERERERERERMDRDDYSPSRSTSTAISPSTPNTTTLDAFVRIKILALEKSRREIYIKFNAETNLPSFRSSLYRSVSRSHTEFIKFAEAVSANNPQSIVPALPLVQSSSLNDQEDDRIVKANYGKWVARICLDGGIVRDEELRNFIESEFGVSSRLSSSPLRQKRLTTSLASVHAINSLSQKDSLHLPLPTRVSSPRRSRRQSNPSQILHVKTRTPIPRNGQTRRKTFKSKTKRRFDVFGSIRQVQHVCYD